MKRKRAVGRASTPARPEGTLDRDAFRAAVFSRDRHRCVLCGAAAVDAHHVLDRKLWPDGGYRLSNGASVCDRCHLRCEMTLVSVEEIRAACGVADAILPDGLDPSRRHDKWGNVILPDGTREPGPLFADDGCRRALARGGALALFRQTPQEIDGFPG